MIQTYANGHYQNEREKKKEPSSTVVPSLKIQTQYVKARLRVKMRMTADHKVNLIRKVDSKCGENKLKRVAIEHRQKKNSLRTLRLRDNAQKVKWKTKRRARASETSRRIEPKMRKRMMTDQHEMNLSRANVQKRIDRNRAVRRRRSKSRTVSYALLLLVVEKAE